MHYSTKSQKRVIYMHYRVIYMHYSTKSQKRVIYMHYSTKSQKSGQNDKNNAHFLPVTFSFLYLNLRVILQSMSFSITVAHVQK